MESYRTYYGYDYTELNKSFNIPCEYQYADHEELQAYIDNVRLSSNKRVRDRTAFEVREYLKVLVEQSREINYDGPLWGGLVEIEDDDVLLIYFSKLCDCAWS